MDFVGKYLGYEHYSLGYGREGRIPHAICVPLAELEDRCTCGNDACPIHGTLQQCWECTNHEQTE